MCIAITSAICSGYFRISDRNVLSNPCRWVERRPVSSPHHADRLRVSDERQSQESHGVSANAGQRPHHRHEPHPAVPPRRRLLPDGLPLTAMTVTCTVHETRARVGVDVCPYSTIVMMWCVPFTAHRSDLRLHFEAEELPLWLRLPQAAAHHRPAGAVWGPAQHLW